LNCIFAHRTPAFSKNWFDLLEARRKGDKQRSLKLLREVFNGFVGGTDNPVIVVIPELLELYPDAKVVLVTRETERWWQSFKPVLASAQAWFLPFLTLLSPGCTSRSRVTLDPMSLPPMSCGRFISPPRGRY
jgi:hypothetical protein